MRDLPHPPRDAIELTDVFHALSDPARLGIVRRLAGGGEVSCGGFGVPLAKSTLSHHFRVLREAGVTRSRADGLQTFISLRRDDLDARFPGLLDAILRDAAVSA